jgi:molecular chaperone GrpE (heat shock protein)
MTERPDPRLPKWPFFLGDLLLLGVAFLVLWQSARPMTLGEMLILAACVALGAVVSVTPFVLEYRYLSKLAQVERLQRALLQVHNIEAVGRQIASATANWQAVQDDAVKALDAARKINETMSAEAQAFQQFLEKAHDTERNHLRLEVEKLHRAESEWLRVLIRILDHVYALFQAALRSGQAALIEQLGTFQRACRDAALRLGVVPFEGKPGDKFDAQLHQLSEENGEPPAEALVGDTLATGYRFQGQLVRRALVALQGARPEPSPLSIRQINRRREETQGAVLTSPATAPESRSGVNPGAPVPGEATAPELPLPANEVADAPGESAP